MSKALMVTLAVVVALFSISCMTKSVDKPTAYPGDTITYTVAINNTDKENLSGTFYDPLPSEVSYVPGSVSRVISGTVTGGLSYDESSRRVQWSGFVAAGSAMTITFRTVLDPLLPTGTIITNTGYIVQGSMVYTDTTTTILVGRPGLAGLPARQYLPMAQKKAAH